MQRIRLEDFDFDRSKLHAWRIKKRGPGYEKGEPMSGAIREWLPLPHSLTQQIQNLGELWGNRPLGPLFITAWGHPCQKRQLQDDWKRLLAEAGVRYVNIHQARHYYALKIARNDKDPYMLFTLRDLLGHANINTSAEYVYRDPIRHQELMDRIWPQNQSEKGGEPNALSPQTEQLESHSGEEVGVMA
jgi:integrase